MSLFYPRLLVSLLMFKLAFAFDELAFNELFQHAPDDLLFGGTTFSDENLIPLDDSLFDETYEDTFGLQEDLWNEGSDVPLSDIDYPAPWGEQIAQAPADLCDETGLGVPVCARENVDDHDRPYPTKLLTPFDRPLAFWNSAVECPNSFYCCRTWNPAVIDRGASPLPPDPTYDDLLTRLSDFSPHVGEGVHCKRVDGNWT